LSPVGLSLYSTEIGVSFHVRPGLYDGVSCPLNNVRKSIRCELFERCALHQGMGANRARSAGRIDADQVEAVQVA